MLDLLVEHKETIKTYRVISYDQEGASHRIKVEITFANDSVLFVKEYILGGTERKYSFHWTGSVIRETFCAAGTIPRIGPTLPRFLTISI